MPFEKQHQDRSKVKTFLNSKSDGPLNKELLLLLGQKVLEDLLYNDILSIEQVEKITSFQAVYLNKFPELLSFVQSQEITLEKLFTFPFSIFCDKGIFDLIEKRSLTFKYLETLSVIAWGALAFPFVHNLIKDKKLKLTQLSSLTKPACGALSCFFIQSLIANNTILIDSVLTVSAEKIQIFMDNDFFIHSLIKEKHLTGEQAFNLTSEIFRTLNTKYVLDLIKDEFITMEQVFALSTPGHHALRDVFVCETLIRRDQSLTIEDLSHLTAHASRALTSWSFERGIENQHWTIDNVRSSLFSLSEAASNVFTDFRGYAFSLLKEGLISLEEIFNITHIASLFLIDDVLRKLVLLWGKSKSSKKQKKLGRDFYQQVLALDDSRVREIISLKEKHPIKTLFSFYALQSESFARQLIAVKKMLDFETANESEIWLNILMIGGGDTAVVECLIDLLRQNDFDLSTRTAGKEEYTAFFWAAHYGLVDVIRELMKKYATDDYPQKSKKGQTMIHIAAERGHWPLFESLFKLSPDIVAPVFCQAENGWTALYHAINNDSSEEWINFLLENGADINTPVANGETPAQLAVKKQRDLNPFYCIYSCLRTYFMSTDSIRRLISSYSIKEIEYHNYPYYYLNDERHFWDKDYASIVEDFSRLLQAISATGEIDHNYNCRTLSMGKAKFYNDLVDKLRQLSNDSRLSFFSSFNERLIELHNLPESKTLALSLCVKHPTSLTAVSQLSLVPTLFAKAASPMPAGAISPSTEQNELQI
jgi:hypothetical protein